MHKPDLTEYPTSSEFLHWAMEELHLLKSKDQLTDHEIGRLMQWLGICSPDTIITSDDFPYIRRMGVGIMLTMTLLEFPEFFMKYELAQFN